ncbi:MAG: thioredoxin, partial [Rhizomicrobium sp.]
MALIGLGGHAAPTPAAAADGLIKEGSIETFAADVLEASKTVPVIVDFWAPWCGPCKQLGPSLEKLVTAAKGRVKLVKINVDENQAIAQQLRIQSIPTVYAFFEGRPVDAFMGALPESQLKTFVDGLIKMGGDPAGDHTEEVLTAAAEALAAGDIGTAAQGYAHVLHEDPGHPKAVAGLAQCYL